MRGRAFIVVSLIRLVRAVSIRATAVACTCAVGVGGLKCGVRSRAIRREKSKCQAAEDSLVGLFGDKGMMLNSSCTVVFFVGCAFSSTWKYCCYTEYAHSKSDNGR